jgi:hypothetical protein
MAAMLTGILWYVIGIGDAIVYRETMQDGADATAYAAAVYHARGMNVIAMLNIIMAAVLAVLVALKICQIIVIIVNTISCALAWTGVGAAVCAATSAAEEPLQSAINTTEQIVDKVLRGLNLAADGIALGMPWVAEAKAVYVANSYSPTVHGGLMVSASLVPGVDIPSSGSSSSGGSMAASFSGSGSSGSSSGTRLGLPVQNDDFDVLCKHAGEDVADIALAPFAAFGIPTSWASGFVGDLVASVPSYFCGADGSSTDSSGIQDKTAKALCDKQQQAVADWNAANPHNKKSFDYDSCMSDANTSAVGGAAGSVGQFSGDEGKASKKVYGPAKNGDDYFAIWSLTWGDLKSQSGAQKGVDVAAWNNAKTADPSLITKVSFAKAEFYYDVRPGSGGAPAKWDDYKDDAMWNLRWRARFRRVTPPWSGLSSAASSIIGSNASDYVSSWLGDASEASAAMSWAGAWPQAVSSAPGASALGSAVGAAGQAASYFTVVH